MTTMNPALAQAARLAPAVEKVHDANHPELTRVRELTQSLVGATDPSRIAAYYAELREVTDNYSVPADACEGLEGAYRSLAESEQIWSGR